MVDIDIVTDDRYVEPKITIHTNKRTEQIDNIIYAIENVSGRDFPFIPAYKDEKAELLSQRDIYRAYTQGRKVMVQTADEIYSVKKSLMALEEDLNPGRFLRISQSEIINLNKVKSFDINLSGTVGIEFDNGNKSWAARSRVKAIKDLLKE